MATLEATRSNREVNSGGPPREIRRDIVAPAAGV